jgi:hypothetical protein
MQSGDQGIGVRVAGQFLIATVGQSAALGPVANRRKIDVDERGNLVVVITYRH